MTSFSAHMSPSNQAHISKHNRGVLIADDNHFFREILKKTFALYQIPVIGEASDGLQAVHLAYALHPAVVLLDLHMPNLDGLSVTQQIKQHQPDTKVIIHSADDALKNQAFEAGADTFLLKGSDLHLLVRSVLA